MIPKPKKGVDGKLNAERSKCDVFCTQLAGAFPWSSSREGVDFWLTLTNRVQAIGSGTSCRDIPDPEDHPLTGTVYRIEVEAAAKVLSAAFDWGATREGSDFWVGVYNRLMELACVKTSGETASGRAPPWP